MILPRLKPGEAWFAPPYPRLLIRFYLNSSKEIREIMALKPLYCLEAAESTTLEISTEGLRALLSQVEAELQHGEVYRKVAAGLQTLLGEASGSAQTLIKVVSREAIRLALQQFARQYTATASAAPELGTESTPNPASSPAPAPSQTVKPGSVIAPVTATPAALSSQGHKSGDKPSHVASRNNSQQPIAPKPPKKRSKSEVAAQMLAQEREERLRQLGQHLKQVRESRSLSVKQLHSLTLVPIYQLESLEAGRIELLPEDIYVRGFLRRIGNALGLEGDRIAASLPAADPNAGVIPSWSRSKKVEPRFCLQPVHLYLGYAALMAGAAGGLALLSQKSNPNGAIGSIAPPASPASASQASRDSALASPGLKTPAKSMATGIFAVGSDIAPPEATL